MARLVLLTLMVATHLLIPKAAWAVEAPFDVEVERKLPRETVRFIYFGGPTQIPKGMQGALTVLGYILSEGPEGVTADEFRNRNFLNTAGIGFSCFEHGCSIDVTAPPEKLAATVALARQTLDHPKFNAAEFERAKEKTQALFEANFGDMSKVIGYYSVRDAFAYHPDTLNGQATNKTLATLTLEQVKEWWKKSFELKHAFYSALGPMDEKAVRLVIKNNYFQAGESFSGYEPIGFAPIEGKKFIPAAPRVVVINKNGATDNQIRFIFPDAISRDAKTMATAKVAMEILGGGNGKLLQTLRRERGLTYYAGGNFSTKGLPYWGLATFGGVDQTAELLKGVPQVLREFSQKEVTDAELKNAMNVLITEFKEIFELSAARQAGRVNLRLFAKPTDYWRQVEQQIPKTTRRDVNQFIKTNFVNQQYILYVMGDSEKVLPALEKAGYKRDDVRIVATADLE